MTCMTKIALYSRPIENPDERAGTCNDVDYFAPRHIASAARVDNWSFDGGIARAPAKRLRPLALQLPQPPSTMTTPLTVTMTVTMMMRLGC